jgi:hypothetical protein
MKASRTFLDVLVVAMIVFAEILSSGSILVHIIAVALDLVAIFTTPFQKAVFLSEEAFM